MQHVTVNARLRRWQRAIRVIAAAATLTVCCVDRSRAGAQDQQSLATDAGRTAYDQYCTPCHGLGGAPGSAVFVTSKQPVDLRTYVQRHGGKFPAGDWLMVVVAEPLNNPHTAIWERLRRDADAGGTGSETVSRAKVRSIADYVISIQAK